jgi:ABC-type Fe3+ transport system substrate-binding protein
LTYQLKTQETTITRNYQQQVEWVGQGKYAVGLWPNPGQVARYLKAGTPIAVTHLKEGFVASPAFGCLGVVAKPAHPNATSVFVNWFLSREGPVNSFKNVTVSGFIASFRM